MPAMTIKRTGELPENADQSLLPEVIDFHESYQG